MRTRLALALCACAAIAAAQAPSIDAAYSAKIKEFTTEPFFLTELIDHLPASSTVPTPEKILGHIAGAPGKLTHTANVHRYLRELAKASPRVRVWVQGTSEEGRETILVAVSDEANLKRLDRLKDITARLADPRRINDAEADKLIAEGVPFYWASGAIHSPETGSPEMLMELAYRLAVSETPFIQSIRRNSVVLITPVLEVDGRDKQVDLYNFRKANPAQAPSGLLYWGRYVAHDNNRDGMALSLNLSRIVMKTFLEYHPQVLHDLHESVPFLYTSTGMGPYNAWLDPIVINEWQKLAYHEVEEMTKRGVPGVWTHGFYDGWAANYMVTAAQGHNAIGRFYETYGGPEGPDTRERTVPAGQTTRTWYRPNPPLPKIKWSLRNNVNMQQSAILFAMHYTAANKETFLRNFYLKSKRSVAKPANEGPAAYVLPADDPRAFHAADLVNLLQLHGVEVHKADGPIEAGKEKFPAASYVIRMDQPYSRMADMLLDRQFYNASDTPPYDDTGWTLGALRNIRTARVTDTAILKTPMTLLRDPVKPEGRIEGPAKASAYLIAQTAEFNLTTFRFKLGRDIKVLALEKPFQNHPAGSFLIPDAPGLRDKLMRAAAPLGLKITALEKTPDVPTHEVRAPRIALVHTWLNTQNEGWYRLAFDKLEIPYSYISVHALRDTPDLRSKYDVILLGPAGGNAQRIVNGIPTRGQPIPWKKSELTPHFGDSPDQSDDIRGGIELRGMAHLQRFIEEGGLFITIGRDASLPIDYGLVEGLAIAPARELRVAGSVLTAAVSDRTSPIVYGYDDKVPVYFSQAPLFQISLTGGAGGPGAGGTPPTRPSGRGTPTDADIPQGRPYVQPPPAPRPAPGEEPPLSEEIRERMARLLPERPKVILRFAPENELLISGMLAGGRELAARPALVQVPKGKGNILMFAINPVWRHQTQGTFALLFNAMLHFDHLATAAASPVATPQPSAEAGEEQH
ncbi:MAG: M14 family zinc carboxypeptidase [Bryobacteraceae bacterium]|nr:M14 family zinc carboxypeptidase [Bryobacteraceae bacterium]